MLSNKKQPMLTAEAPVFQVARITACSALCLVLLIALTACKETSKNPKTAAPPKVVIVVDHVSRVADPKLPNGGVVINYHLEPGGGTSEVVVEIFDIATSTVVREIQNETIGSGVKIARLWDGRDEKKRFVDPGTYEVRIRNASGQSSRPVSVVRLGITEILSIESSEGADDVYPLVYTVQREYEDAEGGFNVTLSPSFSTPRTGEYRNAANPGEVSDLDLDNGEPRPIPPLHTEVEQPVLKDGQIAENFYNYPRCYKMGARSRFKLDLGASATSMASGTPTRVGVGYPIEGFSLRMAIRSGGMYTAVSAPFATAPDGSVSVFLEGPQLPPKVTQFDQFLAAPLEFIFQHQETGCPTGLWEDIPGAILFPLRYYTVLDTPIFRKDMTGGPYAGPWIAVADLCHQWNRHRHGGEVALDTGKKCITNYIQGILQKNDPEGRLRTLEYDFEAHYLTGVPRDPDWPNMPLAALLFLRNGSKVNCTDAMGMSISMLPMMGVENMGGVELEGDGFCSDSESRIVLKATRPLGNERFGTGPDCFRFHRVAARDLSEYVIDVSLQVEPRVVSGWDEEMEYLEYASKLSSSNLNNDVVHGLPFLDGYGTP